MVLGPHEPHLTSLIAPSDVTRFVAELGLVLLLFFLGLEFTFDRVTRTGSLMTRSGMIDLLINGSLGLIIGYLAFGATLAGAIVAGAVYVSSSALTVKGLIDFRRLADDETDLILAILVFEDLVIAIFLGFSGATGPGITSVLLALTKAIAFVGIGVLVARRGTPIINRAFAKLGSESLLLVAVAFVAGLAAASRALGLSEAIGALMAGVILAESDVREEIETRLLAARDLFAALFFFAFGLSVDVAAIGDVGGIIVVAVILTIAGKLTAGIAAGAVTGFTRRQSLNVGAAIVAHGEFTIILVEVANRNRSIAASVRSDLVAFAGLYVLITATVGVLVMKQSKRIGRAVFRARPAEGAS